LATQSGGKASADPTAAFRTLVENGVQDSLSFFFGGRPRKDGTAEFRCLQTYKEFRSDLVRLVGSWRKGDGQRSLGAPLHPYDSVRQPVGHERAQFIDLEEDDYLTKALKALRSAADTPAWSEKEKEFGRPRSFVIEATTGNGARALFFGRITRGQELVGTGKLLAWVEGNRFRALMDQAAFVIDGRFDCVVLPRYFFVMRPGGFESLFAYEAMLLARADERIDVLKNYMEPAQAASLRSAVASNRNLLRQLAGRIRIDLATADHARIRLAIERCKLNVSVAVVDGKLRLGFAGDDPNGLIQLLTDRAVEGIVSRTAYIAPALQRIHE
jgi:hypothetical protein